jgi:hypothetical protein
MALPFDPNTFAGLEGLSDLGLVSPTSGSPTGDPGSALGGPDTLELLRQEIENANRDLATPAPSLDISGKELAGAALGTFIGAAIGGLGGGLEGAVGGVEGGLRGAGAGAEVELAQRMERHQQKLQAANRTLEQRQKLATGLRTLLGQNDALFLDPATGEPTVDPLILGELAFPGSHLSVYPGTKMRMSLRSEESKARGKAALDMVKQMENPQDRAYFSGVFLAEHFTPEEMQLLGPRLMTAFNDQRGDITDNQTMDNFSNPIELLAERQRTGRFPWEKADVMTPEQRQMRGNPEKQRAAEALLKASRHVQQQGALATPRFLSLETAFQEALEPHEQALARKHYPREAGLTDEDLVRLALQADDNLKILQSLRGARNMRNPNAHLDEMNMQIENARKMGQRRNEVDFNTLLLKHRRNIQQQEPTLDVQEVARRATLAAINEMIATGGRESVPQQFRSRIPRGQ